MVGRAIVYIRVSTDEQKIGIEAQREILKTYCQKEGYSIEAEYIDENVSGGLDIDRRPALLEVLEDLSNNSGTTLVVAKRCRLARDSYVAAMVYRLVEREKCAVKCADGVANGSTPEDVLLRGMLDLFAQYERELIRARTRAAMAAKRKRNEYTGGKAPYGFDVLDGDQLVPNKGEQQCADRARILSAHGLSLRQIAEALQSEGYGTRGGSPWTFGRVRTVLKSVARGGG